MRAIGGRSASTFVVSAVTGEGVEPLLAGIEARLSSAHVAFSLALPGEDGEGLSWIYGNAQVLSRLDDPSGEIGLEVKVAPERLDRFKRRFPQARVREMAAEAHSSVA